jgi:hypothetical protein
VRGRGARRWRLRAGRRPPAPPGAPDATGAHAPQRRTARISARDLAGSVRLGRDGRGETGEAARSPTISRTPPAEIRAVCGPRRFLRLRNRVPGGKHSQRERRAVRQRDSTRRARGSATCCKGQRGLRPGARRADGGPGQEDGMREPPIGNARRITTSARHHWLHGDFAPAIAWTDCGPSPKRQVHFPICRFFCPNLLGTRATHPCW